jgi:hypothetical protein
MYKVNRWSSHGQAVVDSLLVILHANGTHESSCDAAISLIIVDSNDVSRGKSDCAGEGISLNKAFKMARVVDGLLGPCIL